MRVCFTGHRPSKLPGGYYYYSEGNIALGRELRKEVLKLINEGANYFICGGALGVDQIAFMVLRKLKSQGHKIHIEVAVPFEQQYIRWSQEQRNFYFEQLRYADKVTYVDTIEHYNQFLPIKTYAVQKLEMRNKYMVDNSDVVIAVWDGSKSGTKNCIDYAYRNHKRVNIIDNIFK